MLGHGERERDGEEQRARPTCPREEGERGEGAGRLSFGACRPAGKERGAGQAGFAARPKE